MRSIALILAVGLAACGTSTPTEATPPAAPPADAPAAAPTEAATAESAPAEHAFGEVSFDELKPLVEGKQVVLVDANGTDMYKDGHIPGAIDAEAAGDTLATLLPADKGALVVAYCGGPSCSAWEGAAKQVAALGYTNVKHFKDGISGWKKANGPVEI